MEVLQNKTIKWDRITHSIVSDCVMLTFHFMVLNSPYKYKEIQLTKVKHFSAWEIVLEGYFL